MKNTIVPIAAAAVSLLFSGALMAGGIENQTFDTQLDISSVKAGATAIPVPAAPAESRRLGDAVSFFNYLDSMFSAPRAVSGTSSFIGSDKGTRAAALYAITLEEVKNQYLMPAIGFKTSKGTFVHISGTKAGNCPIGADSCADKEKFFLVLTPDNGQSQFARVMDIINVPFVYSGSKDLSIDGEKFTVRVSASLTAPETSVIEITKGASKIFSATLAQMSTALAAKGVDVQLSKAYKLAYGNELLQIKGGAKFTDKMLILMLPFPVVDAASYYILNPSEMTPPAGTSYPSMEAGYKFMISGGVLEISRL